MKQIFDRTWAETDGGVRIFLLAGGQEAQLTEGAERIAAGEAAWTEAEVHGNKIRVVDAGIARFLI